MTDTHLQFPRFDRIQRVEHWFLVLSFTVLALTGLPQRWPDNIVGGAMVFLFGGIEWTRKIHHTAAVILIVLTMFHFLMIFYRIYVMRSRMSMLPSWTDIKDGLQALGYNVGAAKNPPQMGRYTFGEKIEYWAVIWGTVVMIFTGFLLWNPIAATNFLPGQAIPAAKAAHGGEALLAVLAIVTWHVYHVHIKHFNKSMFSGELDAEEMIEEHALELIEIESGNNKPVLDPKSTRFRKMVYYPFAIVVGLIVLFGTYYFVTFEQTAIDTIPRQTSQTSSFETTVTDTVTDTMP